MGRTSTTTTRQSNAPRELSIVVGWAAGVVDVWPEERDLYVQPTVPLSARRCSTATYPETVLELLAAADGDDVRSYGRRHAADAGAVLALTHHTIARILAAAVEADEVSPSAVLAALRARMELVESEPHRPLVGLLAS